MNGDIVLWAAALGLLVGIVWSLRYIVIIDKKIARIEQKIEMLLERKSPSVQKKKR